MLRRLARGPTVSYRTVWVLIAAPPSAWPATPSSRPSGKVSTRNPSANTTKTDISALDSFSTIVDISRAASATPIELAMVVFLVSAISTLASGAITARNACGSTMMRRFWVNVRPIARAASAWPAGTVLMPERIASQTNVAV